MRKTLILLAALGAIAPASAQENDYRWIKKATGRVWTCDGWTGFCRWEYRYGYVRVPHYYGYRPAYGPQVYGYVHREDDARSGPRCLNVTMSAVGPEAYNLEKAKEAADSMLMEAIRARHGSRLMDLRHSEALTYECWRSATGNRASEKLADYGGAELHQCSVSARPCRSKTEVADTGDPATELAIRRLRAQGYDIKLIEPANPDEPKKPRIIRRFFKKE